MLKLKIIRGPDTGTEFELKPGETTIGRQDDCDIVLKSGGVSKHHAKITLVRNQCVVTDLRSSNGTYINGVKVQNRSARAGDRIGFHDVIVELIDTTLVASTHSVLTPPPQAQEPLNPPPPAMAAPQPKSNSGLVEKYVDDVIMPGVYRLNQLYSLRGVVAGFLALFVIMVTILATIPMAQLTEQGIRKEGQRRALSLTRQLADYSYRALQTGIDAQLRTDFVDSEDGVISALVVAKDDGHVIAPLSKAQSYPTEEFVARARKSTETLVQDIGFDVVGVSIPIEKFSSESGKQEIYAYAVIQYKLDAVDLSATTSLFARVLLIAIVAGSLLFFFLYRIIANPIQDISQQLDQVLRGEKDSLKLNYDVPEMVSLVENMNAAISRMGSPSDNINQGLADRTGEAVSLVRMMAEPAIALDSSGRILQVNRSFEELTGQNQLSLQGQPLSLLIDRALQLNLEDLVNQSQNQRGMILSGKLDISGIEYEIDLLSSAEGDQILYYVINMKKTGES